ncbi:MAG TPA: transposase [Hyphomicrobium sp.]|jgi:transposase
MSKLSQILAIDISKDNLDTDALPSPWRKRLTNDADGIAAIVTRARRMHAFVVFEATSVYDRRLTAALEAARVPFHRANPRKAREFARAAGILAKTDRVDAAMLAQYAARLDLKAHVPLPESRKALRTLVDRRAQLVEMRKQEQTRLKQTDDAEVRAEMAAAIAEIAARISTYDAKIKALLQADPQLDQAARLLTTSPGVAALTAATLLAHMPELGAASAKTIAALAGLAPLARDSGRWRGQRRIWGGRRPVRRLLFLAARHAAKSARFKGFAEKLRHAGKAPKAILIAVARKLLIALNAMIKTQKPFAHTLPT